MSRRKIESHLDCIAYLSETEGTLTQIEKKESKQEKVIREYANRHNIKVVKTVRRNGFSIDDVYRQFEIMANMIRVGGKAKCKKIEEYIAVLAEERLCM